MNKMDKQPLTPEQIEYLTDLAISTSDELEASGASVTSRAFNQGCVVGLLPAGLFILVIYLVSGGSLTASALSCVLMLMALVIFANLAAAVARYNTNRRVYQERIQSELEASLASQGVSRAQFDLVALQVLPRQAALRDFITPPSPEGATLVARLISRIKSL